MPYIETKMEQCTIPSTLLNNPSDSIKAIYSTQATLLLTAKIHSLVLSAKILFSGADPGGPRGLDPSDHQN